MASKDNYDLPVQTLKDNYGLLAALPIIVTSRQYHKSYIGYQ